MPDERLEREALRSAVLRRAVTVADQLIMSEAAGDEVELAYLTAAFAGAWAEKSLLMQQARLLRQEFGRDARAMVSGNYQPPPDVLTRPDGSARPKAPPFP